MQARTVLLTDTDELTSKLDAEPALFSLLAAFPSLPFPPSLFTLRPLIYEAY